MGFTSNEKRFMALMEPESGGLMPGIYASALQMSINRGTPERGGGPQTKQDRIGEPGPTGERSPVFPNPSLDP